MKNPFIVNGYEGDRWFCDRKQETANLIKYLTNGHNIVLTSPRRVGKTDLVKHVFAQEEIKRDFITVNVDIYATKSFGELVSLLGRAIIDALKPKGKTLIDRFLNILTSLKSQITFDINGYPVWNVALGENIRPEMPLDEIFKFLAETEKPCIISIDEFQQITKYNEGWQTEALLRSHIQQCNNARFIFSGSERHLMSEIFTSPARPFYNSALMMHLPLIGLDTYTEFCCRLFEESGKGIKKEAVASVYESFEGITAYMQRIMNVLFSNTGVGEECTVADINEAIDEILDMSHYNYEALLYQLTERQQVLIYAIARQGRAKNVQSGSFIIANRLPSPSSVMSGIKVLLDKDFITRDGNEYTIYDKFFRLWLLRHKL